MADMRSNYDQFKSGMVTIVGPPNAGKSTLMNSLLGQKISIVTPKPQTTRNRILGVVNRENSQVILVDTPGVHKSELRLNKEMVRIAFESLTDTDAIIYIVDGAALVKKMKEDDAFSVRFLGNTCQPVFLVLNKIDLISHEKLLPVIEKVSALYSFQSIIPLSAKNGDGCENLIREIEDILPVGPQYFPDDIPTDATERFLVGEIIREKVFLLTGQEIPYSSAVIIDAFEAKMQKVVIHASIILERNSQKGIIIGKGGHKLKSIGTAARKDIEKLLGLQVNLKLWVKVKKNWSQNSAFLKELGL